MRCSWFVLQAPAASLLTGAITPTTIIKQVSTVHTTMTATTTLQRPPILQVTAPLIAVLAQSALLKFSKTVKHFQQSLRPF